VLLSSETPSGAFSTNASEDFVFRNSNAALNGTGSGLPLHLN
jgi:hypothetical protein